MQWNDNGRPQDVYCVWRPKIDNLLHEVLLTDFLLPFDGQIVRGKHTDRTLRPDATLTLDDRVFHVELDTGTMGYKAVKRRFQAYKGVTDFVIWVAQTDARMEGLRKRAKVISPIALFTVLGSKEWADWHGNAMPPIGVRRNRGD